MMTKAEVVEILRTNDAAVCRALYLLHMRQTTDERQVEASKYHNLRGFRPAHAVKGSGMAKFFIARGFLTPRQIAYWRAVSPKTGQMRLGIYWRQLAEEAEKKVQREAA